jgi:hypothetical protein
MCNCTSGNLEIPGSRFARPGMTGLTLLRLRRSGEFRPGLVAAEEDQKPPDQGSPPPCAPRLHEICIKIRKS